MKGRISAGLYCELYKNAGLSSPCSVPGRGQDEAINVNYQGDLEPRQRSVKSS